jgi:hypothetical protein
MPYDNEWIIVTPAETNEKRRIRKNQIVSYGKMSRYVYLYTAPFDSAKGYPVQEDLETIDRFFKNHDGKPYIQNMPESADIQNDAKNCLNCISYDQTLERCHKLQHIFDEGRPENYYCNKWKGR